MGEADTFEQYAACRGGAAIELAAPDGRTDLSLDVQLPFAAGRLLAGQSRSNKRGERLRVQLGMLDDVMPNGFAQRLRDLHYCSATWGHYLNAVGISVHMMRHTNWMPDIGTPTRTPHRNAMTIAPGSPFLLRIREAVSRIIEPLEEDDPDRMSVALILRYTLTTLVLAHEYQHAALGHCDIARHLGLMHGMREFGPAEANLIENVHLFRWFEYLADQAALKCMIDLVHDGTDPLLAAGGIFTDLGLRNRLTLVSVGILAGMWHSYASRSAMPDLIHPVPKQRLMVSLRVAREHLEKQGQSAVDIDRTETLALDDLARMSRFCPGLRAALTETAAIRGPLEDDDEIQRIKPVIKALSETFIYESS
jgi:hypothetical protein